MDSLFILRIVSSYSLELKCWMDLWRARASSVAKARPVINIKGVDDVGLAKNGEWPIKGRTWQWNIDRALKSPGDVTGSGEKTGGSRPGESARERDGKGREWERWKRREWEMEKGEWARRKRERYHELFTPLGLSERSLRKSHVTLTYHLRVKLKISTGHLDPPPRPSGATGVK